jgi:hypothetical protein
VQEANLINISEFSFRSENLRKRCMGIDWSDFPKKIKDPSSMDPMNETGNVGRCAFDDWTQLSQQLVDTFECLNFSSGRSTWGCVAPD